MKYLVKHHHSKMHFADYDILEDYLNNRDKYDLTVYTLDAPDTETAAKHAHAMYSNIEIDNRKDLPYRTAYQRCTDDIVLVNQLPDKDVYRYDNISGNAIEVFRAEI